MEAGAHSRIDHAFCLYPVAVAKVIVIPSQALLSSPILSSRTAAKEIASYPEVLSIQR